MTNFRSQIFESGIGHTRRLLDGQGFEALGAYRIAMRLRFLGNDLAVFPKVDGCPMHAGSLAGYLCCAA